MVSTVTQAGCKAKIVKFFNNFNEAGAFPLRIVFSSAPPARSRTICYDCPPTYLLFDIRASNIDAKFRPQSLTTTLSLVTALRDKVAEKLKQNLNKDLMDRIIIGRGATQANKAQRIRIIPLPSIGHSHTDRAIRNPHRILPPS